MKRSVERTGPVANARRSTDSATVPSGAGRGIHRLPVNAGNTDFSFGVDVIEHPGIDAMSVKLPRAVGIETGGPCR